MIVFAAMAEAANILESVSIGNDIHIVHIVVDCRGPTTIESHSQICIDLLGMLASVTQMGPSLWLHLRYSSSTARRQ